MCGALVVETLYFLFFFIIHLDAVQLKAYLVAPMDRFILISATKLCPTLFQHGRVLWYGSEIIFAGGRNMIGGRQLPSWMLKSNAADQANISEIKEVNEEDDTQAVDNKACRIKRKIQRKQPDTGVILLENKSRLLKICEARSKRKLIKPNADQGVSIDESGQEKKVSIKAGKISQQGNDELLDKCEKGRRKRMSNKQPHDQSEDLFEGDMQDKIDIAARKRCKSNAPRRKQRNRIDFMEGLHGGIAESIASDDEVTVEDLMSIAEEYINAEKEKELQKLQNLKFESKVKPPPAATSKIGSEKDLTSNLENRIYVTEKPLSMDSSVMKPLLSGGSIANPVSTGDPARDMLDLFLGPLLLKTSREVERDANIMTEKLMLDHELSQRSHNDAVVEVAPVTKKKSSLKDEVAMLLD